MSTEKTYLLKSDEVNKKEPNDLKGKEQQKKIKKPYLLEPNDLKSKEQQKQIKMFIKNYNTFNKSNILSSQYIYVNVQKLNHGFTSCFSPYKYVDTEMIPYTNSTKYQTYICYDGYFYFLFDFENKSVILYKLPKTYKFSYGPKKYDAVMSEEPLSKFRADKGDLIHSVSIEEQLQNMRNDIKNSHIILQEEVDEYKISFRFM
jgi:hypothetical protein